MTIPARVHTKIWLEHNGDMLLGVGRTELLRRIGELGSLKKAAESLGMSYRAAWGRIKRAEAAMGFALVEDGGTRREGYRLTPHGRKIVDAFVRWQEEVSLYAMERAAELPFVEITEAALTTIPDAKGPERATDENRGQ